jgi:hypothetical protein
VRCRHSGPLVLAFKRAQRPAFLLALFPAVLLMSDPPKFDDTEITALAKRLIAEHLVYDLDWLDWEDVPHLDAETFNRLSREIDRLARRELSTICHHDATTELDSMHLLDLALRGSPDE